MKHSILSFTCIFLIAGLTFAQRADEQAPIAEHLIEVNKEWLHMADAPVEETRFTGESDRIGFHLKSVIEVLRSRIEDLNEEQLAQRNSLLDALEDYADESTFPINTRHKVRTPYFIDDIGTACAVGHLIIESGNEKLAHQIKAEHNYDYIRDITTIGVQEWADDNGFRMDELAWIQPAYQPSNHLINIGQGVNGIIHKSERSYDGQRLYIAGDFTELDGSIPCAGFGYIEDNEYHCLGTTPTGLVRDMVMTPEGVIYAAGLFYVDNEAYPIAKYENESWSYISIPERPGVLGNTIDYSPGSNYRLVVSFDTATGTGFNELWQMQDVNGEEWEHIISLGGWIHTSINAGFLYFGGTFSQYTDHTANDQVVETDGMIQVYLSGFSDDYVTPYTSEYLPERIQSIHSQGSIIYVGGSCDTFFPNTYLSRYQNGVFQPLIHHEVDQGIDLGGIYDIEQLDDSRLLIAGDLTMNDIFVYGSGVGVYDLGQGYLDPISLLNGAAFDINFLENKWIFTGSFTEDIGLPVNHVAAYSLPNSLPELEAGTLDVYPNPAEDRLNIQVAEGSQIDLVQIHDIKGASYDLPVLKTASSLAIDIAQLAPGSYIVTLHSDQGTSSASFIKQ